jgi:DNA-binding NarL/FixJ family response regulator
MQTRTPADGTAAPEGGPLSVVIASHREIVARGLVAMLADHPEKVVVEVAPSLRDVGPAVDVVLYDLAMLDGSGPTPLRELVATSGGRVIGIAESADGAHRHLAEEHGIAGCVPSEVHGDELVLAIAAVAAGSRLPRSVEEQGPLSAREAEIVTLVVQGLSNDEIARKLFISPNTLKSHIRRAYRKVGVTTRAQAVAWATQHGLV